MKSFREFLENIIVENLHPELKSVIQGNSPSKTKHKEVVKKIKDLAARGEKTGIERNMPRGSSRAYLPHQEPHSAKIDGKPGKFKVGTKIAIRSNLDSHHKAEEHDGMSLGQMQNDAENNDYFLNSQYRILKQQDDGSYETNHEHGIFPPLVDHDNKKAHWATVGHSRDIKAGEFERLTKTETHPKGITHSNFVDTLLRHYDRNNGKYWHRSDVYEKYLDHIEKHPLVQKFLDHQMNYDSPPHDYRQKKNMGVFEHPDGSKHIVARDHGFNRAVYDAYHAARMNS
jgi:hypothetical protein